MNFQLHPQLAKDCLHIGQLPLCELLLMNDASYPWLILVPRRPEMVEIYQLAVNDQQQLICESSFIAQQLASTFNADKINIAALGNVVPQLHIHHIVRYRTDPAWPAPVWGKSPARAYTPEEQLTRITLLKSSLSSMVEFFT